MFAGATPQPASVRNDRVRLPASELLAALLLMLLSGLPQVGISLTGLEFDDERLQSRPLTRSLLLDKLLPETTSPTPPLDSDFPPLLTAPPPPLSLSVRVRHNATDGTHKRARWLRYLTHNLYRQHSNYV